MNKNEFYKQLMSEYSFNQERIKANAKRGRYAKQRNLPMFIGMTAAAAVCTVAIGTGIMLMRADSGVNLVQTDGLAALSASERLKRDLAAIEQKADSKELCDVFVTFSGAYSPSEASGILTSYSETVRVKRVYFSDGTQAVGEEQVKAAFEGSSAVTGVVINCEGALMQPLLNDPRVYSVNIVGENDDLDLLVPISPADIAQPDDVPAVPDTSDPVVPEQKPDTSVPEPEEIEPGEIDPNESGDPEEIEPGEIDPNENGDPEGTEPEENGDPAEPTEPNEPQQPEDPAQPAVTDTVPEGVVLPAKPEKLSYQITDIAAENAFFLSNNMLYVKTADAVMLYSFNGSSHRLAVSEDCTDARAVWVAPEGGQMIVSAVGNNGNRNRLLLIDADACTITDMDAEGTVLDGTLVSAGYNASEKQLVMNIKENGVYYVCVTSLEANGTLRYLSTCFESETKTVLLASSGDNVYIAVKDGALTQIYRADARSEKSSLIKTYDNSPVISKNLAFTHAVLAPAENAVIGFTEIFDPATESFIRTDFFNDTVTFGASEHCYSVNGTFYTVSGGSISANAGASDSAAIDYKKALSERYSASLSDGVIKITDSPRALKTSGAELYVGNVGDNCSAELKKAAEKAVSLHNALALGLCKDSGISDGNMLDRCVNALYSRSAAETLRNLCGIAGYGELRYNGTKLVAADASTMVLSISSETADRASGKLYFYLGTLGGKQAYSVHNVSFAKENGVWKLDCVIV
ncbi:MAG: hypothetical protein ACI4J8_01685 [Oscillospiraceae bacterium]